MTKFFKKIGRFFKKIWAIIKKVIATILAIVIVCVLIGVVLSILPAKVVSVATANAFWASLSNIAATMVGWIGSLVPAGPGAWFTRASAGVRGWVAGEWAAAAAVSLGVGFGTMPNTMEWAIRRQVDGAKYVGETVIEAVGDLAETAVEVTAGVVNTVGSSVLSSPILLLAVGGLLWWKFGRNGAAVEPSPMAIESATLSNRGGSSNAYT